MYKAILFDWGDTIMRVFPDEPGPMINWSRLEEMPNATKTLEILSRKADLYLATNAADSTKVEIIEALKRVNLDKYFMNIYCFKEIGFKKPSKEYFDKVISLLHFDRSEILMVGDHLENDIFGANQFGINGILYDWGNQYPEYKGRKISDLIELTDSNL